MTAPTYAQPNVAQASVCHQAVAQRVADTGSCQRSQADRLWFHRRWPMPVTRTSLPGLAVVAVVKRWRASRLNEATRSWAVRSTAGRQMEVNTVGRAKTARSN